MKIRSGFVSNSSTSSFMLAIKGKELYDVEQVLLDLFKVPDNYPMPDLGKELAKRFIRNAKLVLLKELYRDYVYNDDDRAVELVKDGYTIYMGSFSNEVDDAYEYLLCNESLFYESPDKSIIIDYSGVF